ncbi:hypothetical protein HD554DRAFT_2203701 [Boletus coccyginus]|nr:hypothetical protein HD554DRAFT_2203701 [Boletus coccyginus]
MHFAKTYTQLLVTLPPEFRNNAFEYRKLKRLINQTALELDSLGLGPSVLRSLLEHGQSGLDLVHSEEQDEISVLTSAADPESVSDASYKHTIVYEITFNSYSSAPEARLRLSRYPSDVQTPPGSTPSTTKPIYHIDLLIPEQSLYRIIRALLHPPIMSDVEMLDNLGKESDHFPDLIIPLPSDTAFFQLLTSTLASLSRHSDTLQAGFISALTTLARSISLTALPASSSAPHSFSAYSLTAHNSATLRPRPGGKSDLYTWREIFGLYTEAEVFESVSESSWGERSIEEVEKHLKLFEGLVQEKKASLALPGSREAFDVFLNLNSFILHVKKFQLANSEATRKILKKHAKRATFPIPSYLLERDASTFTSSSRQVPLITPPSKSLPRLLVQAIGEVLLPVVPHIDDYACLICTSIAFKPIRLCCGHFFCVRCLAKLQKRGMEGCPMCRAPTVLKANPSNIDYGLLNFMADWFPNESREKLLANEREVTKEQLEELGISDIRVCRIM